MLSNTLNNMIRFEKIVDGLNFDCATVAYAYAAYPELGHNWFDHMSRFKDKQAIVAAYEDANGDLSAFDTRLAMRVAESGIEPFRRSMYYHAKQAFRYFCELDKSYAQTNGGRHFKGYFSYEKVDELVEYMLAVEVKYDRYLAGGFTGEAEDGSMGVCVASCDPVEAA